MYSENFFASPLVFFTCPNIHNQKYIYFQEAFMTITEITKKYEKRVNLTEEKIQEIFNNVQTLLDTIPEKEINDMKEKSIYWNDRDISLFNYLEKYEEACALSKSLKKKNKSTTKKMKI